MLADDWAPTNWGNNEEFPFLCRTMWLNLGSHHDSKVKRNRKAHVIGSANNKFFGGLFFFFHFFSNCKGRKKKIPNIVEDIVHRSDCIHITPVTPLRYHAWALMQPYRSATWPELPRAVLRTGEPRNFSPKSMLTPGHADIYHITLLYVSHPNY